MDDIVKQALAKWPNVPHCYGWLALDARGNWRMRDERAQALGLAGDVIRNPALLAFINRNYTHDERGSWYFQNGPQRVYVDLQLAPYIARTDPVHELILHTGEMIMAVDSAWMTDCGRLLLICGDKVAAIDDRDMAECLGKLQSAGRAMTDEQILAWFAQADDADVTFHFHGAAIPVRRIADEQLAQHFGFVATPRAKPRSV